MAKEKSLLPVTILTGFLGSGKTTLMKHFLNEIGKQEKKKVAVFVNDMAAVNVDAALVRRVHEDGQLVEFQNGCICCTLREDLFQEILKICTDENANYDYLLIESTGIAEPMPIAETFTFSPDENEKALKDISRLDTMVTVVDCTTFHKYMKTAAGKEIVSDDGVIEHNVVSLLVDQVEFADVLVLNKSDLVSDSEVEEIKAVCRELNSHADIIVTTYGRVPLEKVCNTHKFSWERAAQAPGWLTVLRGEEVPETEEYGISHVVWRSRRPLHPGRTWEMMNGSGANAWPGDIIVRSKGFFWLSSRTDTCGSWHQAGPTFHSTSEGPWWVLESTETPEGLEGEISKENCSLEDVKRDWGCVLSTPGAPTAEELKKRIGDRRQELVNIGFKAASEGTRKRIEALLESCLLSDDELIEFCKETSFLEKEINNEEDDEFGDLWNEDEETADPDSDDSSEGSDDDSNSEDEDDHDHHQCNHSHHQEVKKRRTE